MVNNILINPNTGLEYINVPPKVAARYLDVGTPFIYDGLRKGALPFGTAVKSDKGRWTYNIPVERLKSYKNATDLNLQGVVSLIESLKTA